MTRKRKSRAIVTQSKYPYPPFDESAITVGDLLTYLAPAICREGHAPIWPPDAFALVSSLLQESGAYTKVVSKWPPGKYKDSPQIWVRDIESIGKKWRENCVKNARPPKEINEWWGRVLAQKQLPVARISTDRTLCQALLQLCAASDEASAGVGVPYEGEDAFDRQAQRLLRRRGGQGSTLCRSVRASKIRVLPKLHTPQNGMTIRSLTHHLALCQSGDVEVVWHRVPFFTESLSLNLLLVPWPNVAAPSQFRAVPGGLDNMPKCYGFFTYDQPIRRESVSRQVLALFENARKVVGRIDGVILPELALTNREHEQIRPKILKRGAFLICGVGKTSLKADAPGQNSLAFDVPVGPGNFTRLDQQKHHRWRLDKRQIVQYGLGGSLDPNRFWWEHIPIDNRQLKFAAMRPWLTLTALICEDLARQDPVADLVRAVGPNLVVALLMDGPQLSSRWSARYATVLADDPGSSVLTLTSVGMAELSRPLHQQERSRVVALWKDAKSGEPVEIELPDHAEGIVLCLTRDQFEEWTADGRSDHCATGYPILSGIHPVAKDA